MSVSVSQAEGKKITTITSNPNSKWPILCQILGALCHSPVCAVPQHAKSKRMNIYMSLGIMQIIVGILNVLTGVIFLWIPSLIYSAPFWLGGVFIAIGIVSIVAAKVSTYYLKLAAVVLNKVSAVLSMIGLALYAWDLENSCSNYFVDNYLKIRMALDITMMVFSALQLCTTLSFSVLTLTEICDQDEKFVEDTEFYKPLKEEKPHSNVC